MLVVYLAVLFKHPWDWGGDLDTGPASGKEPLAGRSTCPQWTPLPETGKSCLFLLLSCQHKCFQSLCSCRKEDPGPRLCALKFLH